MYGVWFKSRGSGRKRNTPVVVKTNDRQRAIKTAKARVRRPSDPVVVSARKLTGASRRTAAAGRWVRERADGSAPKRRNNARGFGPRPRR